MNQPFDPEFIERIVQEVIRRLLKQGLVGGTTSVGETELALSDKVVTLATLDGGWGGVKRLVVGGRSFAPPAVKDELKDRSIELVRR